MLVEEAMTTDLVTVGRGATVRDAALAMLRRRAGSALVCEDGVPVGIVTESDVLRSGCDRDEPLAAIPVEAAMSEPLETVPPTATLQTALRRMEEAGVKKLVVVDGVDHAGIVTTTDVARHLPDAVSAARRVESHHDEWEE